MYKFVKAYLYAFILGLSLYKGFTVVGYKYLIYTFIITILVEWKCSNSNTEPYN